jgi:hypothetical protein
MEAMVLEDAMERDVKITVDDNLEGSSSLAERVKKRRRVKVDYSRD